MLQEQCILLLAGLDFGALGSSQSCSRPLFAVAIPFIFTGPSELGRIGSLPWMEVVGGDELKLFSFFSLFSTLLFLFLFSFISPLLFSFPHPISSLVSKIIGSHHLTSNIPKTQKCSHHNCGESRLDGGAARMYSRVANVITAELLEIRGPLPHVLYIHTHITTHHCISFSASSSWLSCGHDCLALPSWH